VGGIAQPGQEAALGVTPSQAAASALAWWLAAGVDCPLGAPEGSGSWLQPTAKPAVPERPRAEPAIRQPPAAPPTQVPDSADEAWRHASTLAELQAALAGHPLFDGDPASGLMLMGEGPSAEDLRTLRPFSGPAGDLLNAMLAAIGRDRASAYITNLCIRRTAPGTPSPSCVARDLDLARRHVALVRPRALVLLGGVPAAAITGDRSPVMKARGRWHDLDFGGVAVPTLVTVNPAYLLRRPLAKREAWADLRSLQQRLSS
jgi:DNA polymerase